MTQRAAFYAIEDFPELKEICLNWELIREELLQLDASVMNIHREGKKYAEVIENIMAEMKQGKEYGWIQGWGKNGGNDEWIQFGLLSFNEQVNTILEPLISRMLPKTHEMIRKIKGVKICAFAKLKSQSMLHCHTHPEIHDEGLLQLHLPLVTAKEKNYAYLNVMGEFRQHQCGKPIIFDGSLDHFAINESDEDRTILYVEFKTAFGNVISNN